MPRLWAAFGAAGEDPEVAFVNCALLGGKRQWFEQLGYDLWSGWFLDMPVEEEILDATVVSKNRERLMEDEVGLLLFDAVVKRTREAGLMSAEHFSVDGTLIKVWVSPQCVRPKAKGNPLIKIRDIQVNPGGTFTRRNAKTTLISLPAMSTVLCFANGRTRKPS